MTDSFKEPKASRIFTIDPVAGSKRAYTMTTHNEGTAPVPTEERMWRNVVRLNDARDNVIYSATENFSAKDIQIIDTRKTKDGFNLALDTKMGQSLGRKPLSVTFESLEDNELNYRISIRGGNAKELGTFRVKQIFVSAAEAEKFLASKADLVGQVSFVDNSPHATSAELVLATSTSGLTAAELQKSRQAFNANRPNEIKPEQPLQAKLDFDTVLAANRGSKNSYLFSDALVQTTTHVEQPDNTKSFKDILGMKSAAQIKGALRDKAANFAEKLPVGAGMQSVAVLRDKEFTNILTGSAPLAGNVVAMAEEHEQVLSDRFLRKVEPISPEAQAILVAGSYYNPKEMKKAPTVIIDGHAGPETKLAMLKLAKQSDVRIVRNGEIDVKEFERTLAKGDAGSFSQAWKANHDRADQLMADVNYLRDGDKFDTTKLPDTKQELVQSKYTPAGKSAPLTKEKLATYVAPSEPNRVVTKEMLASYGVGPNAHKLDLKALDQSNPGHEFKLENYSAKALSEGYLVAAATRKGNYVEVEEIGKSLSDGGVSKTKKETLATLPTPTIATPKAPALPQIRKAGLTFE